MEDEIIQKAVVSLEEFGFINYFGLQRFGTSQVAPTHVIGKALLQDDFKQVRLWTLTSDIVSFCLHIMIRQTCSVAFSQMIAKTTISLLFHNIRCLK